MIYMFLIWIFLALSLLGPKGWKMIKIALLMYLNKPDLKKFAEEVIDQKTVEKFKDL